MKFPYNLDIVRKFPNNLEIVRNFASNLEKFKEKSAGFSIQSEIARIFFCKSDIV